MSALEYGTGRAWLILERLCINSRVLSHRHLQVGDVLLIDATGFAFWLWESGGLEPSATGGATKPLTPAAWVSCDYASLDARIRRTVKLFTEGCGLRLCFYFDGPASPDLKESTAADFDGPTSSHLKKSTATKRNLQRHDEWDTLQ